MLDIRREHIVPMNVLESMLFPIIEQNDFVTAERVLTQFGDMALISQHEDQELNRLGLRDRMPDPNDPMSRYSRAEINLIGRLSSLSPNYRVNRGGRGRLCCRDIQNLSRPDFLKAIKYHLQHLITGRPVAGELLRSWQLGQDFLVSEEAYRILNSR